MKFLQAISICICLLAIRFSFVSAQDDLISIGIIKPSSATQFQLAEQGFLDMLSIYGFEDEVNINLRLVDAQGDIEQLPSLAELLIAEELDILLAIATLRPTLSVTNQLENPPAIFFTAMQNPMIEGVIEGVCDKPSYVTGQAAYFDMKILFEEMRELEPELSSIAFVYNQNDPSAQDILNLLSLANESYNFRIMAQAINGEDEVMPVYEALLISGAESILIADTTVANYLIPLTELSIQASVPVFALDARAVYSGATMGIGIDFYEQGVSVARMLIAYMNGDMDIASMAISTDVELISALNIDTAFAQNIDISEQLLNDVNFFIQNGESTEQMPSLPILNRHQLRDADLAIVHSLQCSPSE